MSILDRRTFLTRLGGGLGSLALADLLWRDQARADNVNPLAARKPHFAAKAKAVIFLFMQGGPSHLETFDPKPLLRKLEGQPLPASFDTGGLSLQFMKASDGKLMSSPFTFRR